MAQLNRARISTAILILLSATSIAEETKKCYWCGPLAEQVHRSQRAPSCDQELQETTCDVGYTHCAVVATSPPYVESRLCVKFYQDECYSLYCNSTKTWRMICPCQGDLCNGHNTERENKAFASLNKIAAKNIRDKRSLILGLQKMSLISENLESIALTEDNETTQITTQSNELVEGTFEMNQPTTVMINEPDSVNQMENAERTEDDEVKNENNLNEMQADQPVEEQIDISKASENTEVLDKTVDETKNIEPTKSTDEGKMIAATNAMTVQEEIRNENTVIITMPDELVKQTQETTSMPTDTSMKPTSIEIELSVVKVKNATVNLPPPEALQQTETPTQGNPPNTMGTIKISTIGNQIVETTTQSMKRMEKGGASRILNNLLTLFTAIILHNAL